MTFNLRKSILPLTLVFFIIIVTQIYKEENNPDWFGYLTIYNGGSWLADQDRDPGFLAIISIFKAVFGSNSYLIFRQILNIYFALFAYFLCRGKILEFSENRSKIFFVFLSILPLIFVRFPIQIREGIALTFIVFSLRYLFKNIWENEGKDNRKRNNWLTLLFLFLAALVHSGTAIFLLAFLLAIFFNILRKKSEKLYSIFYHIVVLIFIISALLLPLYFSLSIGTLIRKYGYYIEDITSLNDLKILYWLIYGVFVFLIRVRMIKYSSSINDTTAKIYLKLIGNTILVSIYILSFFSIILKFPATFVSVLLRSLNLLICISLILLAYHTKNHKLVFATSIFLIIDQFRIVTESIQNSEFG